MTDATCSVSVCDGRVSSRGWCDKHYRRWRKYGDPEGVAPPAPLLLCSVDDCGRPHCARGLCERHYRLARRNGDTGSGVCTVGDCGGGVVAKDMCHTHYYAWRKLDPNRPACNIVGCDRRETTRGLCSLHVQRLTIKGSVGDPGLIRAAHGEGSIHKLSGYRYICTNGRKIAEHRWVMEQMLGRELREGENVHHRNGIRLDNRPENLELWTTPQPAGQRVEDLVEWVVENYPEYIESSRTRAV